MDECVLCKHVLHVCIDLFCEYMCVCAFTTKMENVLNTKHKKQRVFADIIFTKVFS